MSKALLYDATACIGCKQCEGACATQNKLPYTDAVAAEEIQSEHKFTVVLTKGDTKFGESEELIAEAQQRIRDNPGKYVERIYGVNEVGGTSVLLLSSVPFEEFGYRTDLTRDPLPMYTYRVLSRIPDFVPLGGMALGGIWWITHRREEVAAAEGGHGTEPVAKKESGQ